MIFDKNWISYYFSKISQQKIPEIKMLVKIIKLTRQMISKLRNSICIEILQLEIPKKQKLSNFTLYFRSNCPRKSTLKFILKMNNSWSNVKLKGQSSMKFYESNIHRKLIEQGIEWKLNQMIWT